MKIVVLGLWHLGCVTRGLCAKVESVIGVDSILPLSRSFGMGNRLSSNLV